MLERLLSIEPIDFYKRKEPEDKYISWFLSTHPQHIKNQPGPYPDITKPDGTYLEIKVIRPTRDEYNYVVQCHGFDGRGEIDNWFKQGILNKIEIKFICLSKIVIISAFDYWNLIHMCFLNREKTYKPLKDVKIIDAESDETSSKTAFYFVKKSLIDGRLIRESYEEYEKGRQVYRFIYKELNLNDWF